MFITLIKHLMFGGGLLAMVVGGALLWFISTDRELTDRGLTIALGATGVIGGLLLLAASFS